jgi:S-adenosylmethionine uptake transporter
MAEGGQAVRGAVLALAAFAVFAVHDAGIKALGSRYDAVQILFQSLLLGFPIAFAMLIADPAPATFRPARSGWVLARTAAITLSSFAAFHAFTVLPLAQTYAILFTMPLIVTLLAIPLLGERIGWRRGLALVVGFAGVLIVLRPGAAPLGFGHLAALVASASSAFGAVVVRRVGGGERSSVLIVYPMLAAFILSGAMMPWVYRPVALADMGLLAVVALAAFGGMWLVILAYRAASAAIVAPMQYSQIVWAVLFGALFFDEWPDATTLAGALVVILSGLYIVRREARLKSGAGGVR